MNRPGDNDVVRGGGRGVIARVPRECLSLSLSRATVVAARRLSNFIPGCERSGRAKGAGDSGFLSFRDTRVSAKVERTSISLVHSAFDRSQQRGYPPR